MNNNNEIAESQNLFLGNLYLNEVKEQIEKDFGSVGFCYKNTSFQQIQDLLPELITIIQHLRAEKKVAWMRLVYRVDLTEKQYKFVKLLGGDTDENMAKAVLLREFQKVQTRHLFQ
jgi:hypothetical protein